MTDSAMQLRVYSHQQSATADSGQISTGVKKTGAPDDSQGHRKIHSQFNKRTARLIKYITSTASGTTAIPP